MFWGALGVLVGDVRLSRFMLSTQACVEDTALFWGRASFKTNDDGWDKFAEVFNLVEGTHCPGGWDVFPWDFPAPLVESTLLSKVAGCLVSFELLFGVFRRSLHIFLVGCTARVAVFDCETVRSCSFSVATFELFGWDRLKGIGLVHGFFFFAFPCRNTWKLQQHRNHPYNNIFFLKRRTQRHYSQSEVSPPTYSETDWIQKEFVDEGSWRGRVADWHQVAQVPSYRFLSSLGPCSHSVWNDEVRTRVWLTSAALAFCFGHSSTCVHKTSPLGINTWIEQRIVKWKGTTT